MKTTTHSESKAGETTTSVLGVIILIVVLAVGWSQCVGGTPRDSPVDNYNRAQSQNLSYGSGWIGP